MSRVAEAGQEAIQQVLDQNKSIARDHQVHDALVAAGFTSLQDDYKGVREFARSVGYRASDGFIWQGSDEAEGWDL